jgi:hypothetical protein
MEFNQAITTLELEDYVQRQGQLWTIPKWLCYNMNHK